MNTDLIAQLSKLNPTKRQWVYDGIRLIRCHKKNLFISHDAKQDDIHLITLAPTMRIEILDMTKEIEELKEERNRLGKGIEDIINGDSHRPTLEIIEILKMVHTPIGEFYCQRDIEGKSKCDNTCDHCNEYYKPLKNQ